MMLPLMLYTSIAFLIASMLSRWMRIDRWSSGFVFHVITPAFFNALTRGYSLVSSTLSICAISAWVYHSLSAIFVPRFYLFVCVRVPCFDLTDLPQLCCVVKVIIHHSYFTFKFQKVLTILEGYGNILSSDIFR
jgi:hypothetical protein